MAELDALMRKPTGSAQLAAFLFVGSGWHEPHDAVQCRAHGSTFEFLFEFKTEFFSNFLFEFQVVRESNRSTFEGPLYFLQLIFLAHPLCMCSVLYGVPSVRPYQTADGVTFLCFNYNIFT
jgi:hypothetical protein